MSRALSRPEWLQASLAAARRFHFRTASSLPHNLRNLGWLAALLAGMVGLVALGRVLPLLPWVLLAGPGLGLCFFAIVVLVVHEASHGMFVLARDTRVRLRWNRRFGTAAAMPFGIDYRVHWEQGHITHHLRPLEPDDPQRFNRLTGRELVRTALLYLLVPGWALVHRFASRSSSKRRHTSRSVLLGALVWWALAGGLATLLVGPGVWLVLLVAVQVLFGLNQLKGSLEHGGPIASDPDPLLRSRTTLFPGRRLLMPFHITLHFEHHLAMGVPWYRLPDLHEELRGTVPSELQPHLFNRALLAQLMGRLGTVPRA